MAEAKARTFTATHGVEFADTAGGKYVKWAAFTRAPHREEPGGRMVFEFTTSDPKVAARLAGVNDYGITEVPAGEVTP